MSGDGPTISACILARNEEHRIEDALRSLQGWTDQILVIDNESEDRTAEIARRYTPHVLTAPRAVNFDAIRNLAIEHATGTWIFYIDADERVPPRLGPQLRRLLRERGHEFEALVIPFKHYFCGRWIQHSGWWPGYTRPQLLKKDRFRYNERLHSGVEVVGRTLFFPADDPELAIIHLSYDDLPHYLTKLNRYTDGESESLREDGASHSRQAQLAHFVHDWQIYYERGRADLDGMHGFVLAFVSAFYRFASRAKLWDLRRKRDELAGDDAVPADLPEMLEFMARVVQEGAERWLAMTPSPPHHLTTPPVPLLWHGPLLDASGYADEGRQFVLGLIEAGEPMALAPCRWPGSDAGVAPEVSALIEERSVPAETPAELFVSHTLPFLQRPSSQVRFNIARTMFETDRLPPGWEDRLNAMDRIWVPSEFNRETFIRSGVEAEKIAVIPGAIDPAPFAAAVEPWPVPGDEAFRFLSVFDWTLHKGWDVLLEAFALEFGRDGGTHRRDAEDAEVAEGKRGRQGDRETRRHGDTETCRTGSEGVEQPRLHAGEHPAAGGQFPSREGGAGVGGLPQHSPVVGDDPCGRAAAALPGRGCVRAADAGRGLGTAADGSDGGGTADHLHGVERPHGVP